jgi:anti-anti-sigma factor
MRFKIDTREKFHAITIQESTLAANMTAEIDECLLSFLQNGVKNTVLNLKDIQNIDKAAAEGLVRIQHKFNERDASFVICEIRKEVKKSLDEKGLLELMNVTLTESEAQDIVQMEVLERELLDGEAPI